MNIKEIRKAKDWTQAELAYHLGVTTTTIANWEQGVSRPSPLAQRQLDRLARKIRKQEGK